MNRKVVLKASNLRKSYREGNRSLEVLKGVDLTVMEGEVVAIVGTSGSGKTTLLQCLGGLDTFDAGSVVIGEEDLSRLTEEQRTRLRNRNLGFVYQFHHLLGEFTALENVAMPLKIRRVSDEENEKASLAVLKAMGLSERVTHLPNQLSGGERQRVAIARAVVGNPICLLADEPTGNLDRETAEAVFSYLLNLARQKGLALVVVTHDKDIASKCDRELHLKDGVIQERETNNDNSLD